MNKKFIKDYQQFSGNEYSVVGAFLRILKNPELKYIFYGRITEYSNSKLIKLIFAWKMRKLTNKSGNEIDFSKGKIGGGLSLVHPFCITVNPNAQLGENVVLFKGCTIGSVRSGKRAGVPIIGNRVVVGCNSMICGGVKIGNDVLIAANSFVDTDIPSDSLVIGNPCRIIPKENASKDYIVDIGDEI